MNDVSGDDNIFGYNSPFTAVGGGGVPPSSLSNIRLFISCDQLLRTSVRRFRWRAVDGEYVTLALLLVLLRRPNIVEELVMCGLCCVFLRSFVSGVRAFVLSSVVRECEERLVSFYGTVHRTFIFCGVFVPFYGPMPLYSWCVKVRRVTCSFSGENCSNINRTIVY